MARPTPGQPPAGHPSRGGAPQALTVALTFLFLIPPLLLALWGGIEILRGAYAPWQWPWGVFFLGVALSPLLIVVGRRGVRLSNGSRTRPGG